MKRKAGFKERAEVGKKEPQKTATKKIKVVDELDPAKYSLDMDKLTEFMR